MLSRSLLRGWSPGRWFLLGALALGACQPPSVQRELSLMETVDELRLRDDVRALVALGPRMGGTVSGERAAEWRAGQFATAGLTVRVLEDPAKWCHEEGLWSVAVEVNGALEDLESAQPWGFSPPGKGAGVLSTEPERGTVLLAERLPGAEERSGVLAALIEGSTTPDGRYPLARDQNRERAPGFPVFGLSDPDAARLRSLADEVEGLRVRFSLDTLVREASPSTVEARLAPAAGAPAGFLLICAHGDSDSGGPGANDNGSGEAIVLELARRWAQAVQSGQLPAPPREVRFAIWGSEIHSSRAYLDAHAADLLGVINFDQSGFGSTAERLYVEPDDLAFNGELVGAFAEVMADHASTPYLPEEWATVRSQGGTDSYIFSDAEIPAVTIYTSAWNRLGSHEPTPGMPGASWTSKGPIEIDFDNFYHSAGDTPENTTDREPWNMAWCVRAGWLTALRWLDGLGSP